MEDLLISCELNCLDRHLQLSEPLVPPLGEIRQCFQPSYLLVLDLLVILDHTLMVVLFRECEHFAISCADGSTGPWLRDVTGQR